LARLSRQLREPLPEILPSILNITGFSLVVLPEIREYVEGSIAKTHTGKWFLISE
jgi:hypothetical protein